MKLSDETKVALKRIQDLSGTRLEDCRLFFETLAVLATYEYIEGNPITIPFLGSFEVKYLGDKVKKKGREAMVDVSFTPDPAFLRIVGQIADGEEVNDAEAVVMKRIKKDLENLSS